MKISFIGGGTMAEAMVGGILRQSVAKATDIRVGEPVEARRSHLAGRHGITASADNLDAARSGDIIVLSIKPQDLSQVLGQLHGKLTARQAVLSIVAGAKLDAIATGLGHDAVVRAMPNTPGQIGAGITLWLASPSVGKAQKDAARAILRTLGEEMEVTDEKYMDMATALSASGPAYVFLFLESLTDAGVHIGMPREMARTLALHTVLGSARLALESGKHMAELRDMVASPGGTTVEALLALEEGGFRATVVNAVVAAYDKAKRLGEEK